MLVGDLITTLREYDPDAEVHIVNPSYEEVSAVTRVVRLDILHFNRPDRHIVLETEDEPGYVDDLEPSAMGDLKSSGPRGMRRVALISENKPIDDAEQSGTDSNPLPHPKKRKRVSGDAAATLPLIKPLDHSEPDRRYSSGGDKGDE
jgi:hypothetical protein